MFQVKNILSIDFFFFSLCVYSCQYFFGGEKNVQEQMEMSFSGKLRAGEVFWGRKGVWGPLEH